MVTTTLDAMAAGGIYDHVGGGFARYSTDTVWLVPHFEKMLYDQALLVGAYLRGHLRHRHATATARSSRRRSATCCATCATRTAGFFSAEDADSEGVEGKFFLWSPAEIEAVCGDDAAEVARGSSASTAGRQLRRSAHAVLGQHPAPGRPARAAPRRGRGARCRSCSRRASSGSGPGSTTRCSRRGTRCSPGR